MQPETRYARLGRDRIAYQVLGQGPSDLVLAVGVTVDVAWEEPGAAFWLRNLASFSRLIFFDRRGSGASDPLPSDHLPPWESYAEELDAVMDAVGSERAALLADIVDGPTALLFAGTRPERTSALILMHTTAKYVASADYPTGIPAEVAEMLLDQIDQSWGTDAMAAIWVPSRAGDERLGRWWAKMERARGSPRAVKASLRAVLELDVRPVLPLTQTPTLVLHRKDFHAVPIEHGRYLAEHIPGAKLVELPGADLTPVWEAPELALDLIVEFLTGVHRIPEPKRVLATVLFSDIVDSTKRAGQLGDRRWRERLDVHDELARRLVEEFGGQLVKTTGDGMLATFDGPGRGIRRAAALRDELRGIGFQIRVGLHTGEVEQRDSDIGGIAVHIAARVMAVAGPGRSSPPGPYGIWSWAAISHSTPAECIP